MRKYLFCFSEKTVEKPGAIMYNFLYDNISEGYQ